MEKAGFGPLFGKWFQNQAGIGTGTFIENI
jgi:hypothetical protein